VTSAAERAGGAGEASGSAADVAVETAAAERGVAPHAALPEEDFWAAGLVVNDGRRDGQYISKNHPAATTAAKRTSRSGARLGVCSA
jgi:hypothetical protein